MKGKTKSGFKFDANEKIRNDFRFVRAIAETNGKDEAQKMVGYTTMIRLLLGEDGVDSLCAHVAETDGTVPMDKIDAELADILTQMGERGKK